MRLFGKNNPNFNNHKFAGKKAYWVYKDGRTLKEYYCDNPKNNQKCKIRIGWNCAINGSHLCNSCVKKDRKLSKKHKEKIRKWSLIYGFKKGHRINIGRVPWNIGKTYSWSEETKLKYRKKRPKHKGNYVTSFEKLIRVSNKYKIWRTKIFKRDKYICQECLLRNKKGLGKSIYLEVHHKKLLIIIINEFLKLNKHFSLIKDKLILLKLANKYNDFWNIDNGITLCKKCHKKTKAFRERDNNGRFLCIS